MKYIIPHIDVALHSNPFNLDDGKKVVLKDGIVATYFGKITQDHMF